jgi:hypothetical protein
VNSVRLPRTALAHVAQLRQRSVTRGCPAGPRGNRLVRGPARGLTGAGQYRRLASRSTLERHTEPVRPICPGNAGGPSAQCDPGLNSGGCRRVRGKAIPGADRVYIGAGCALRVPWRGDSCERAVASDGAMGASRRHTRPFIVGGHRCPGAVTHNPSLGEWRSPFGRPMLRLSTRGTIGTRSDWWCLAVWRPSTPAPTTRGGCAGGWLLAIANACSCRRSPRSPRRRQLSMVAEGAAQRRGSTSLVLPPVLDGALGPGTAPPTSCPYF